MFKNLTFKILKLKLKVKMIMKKITAFLFFLYPKYLYGSFFNFKFLTKTTRKKLKNIRTKREIYQKFNY